MSEEFISKISQSAQHAISRLHVRSALNPMLWLSAIALLLCIPAAYVFKEDVFLSRFLIIFPCAITAVTCLLGLYFGIYKPDKLQSEDYQIRHQAIQLIEAKGGRIPAGSLEVIANPAARLIEKGGLEDK